MRIDFSDIKNAFIVHRQLAAAAHGGVNAFSLFDKGF